MNGYLLFMPLLCDVKNKVDTRIKKIYKENNNLLKIDNINKRKLFNLKSEKKQYKLTENVIYKNTQLEILFKIFTGVILYNLTKQKYSKKNKENNKIVNKSEKKKCDFIMLKLITGY